MDIYYLGANCLKISTKKTTIFVDPVVPGLKVDTTKSGFNMVTNKDLIDFKSEAFLINTPGEYEIGGLSVRGIATRAHMDEPDSHRATMFKITHDNFNVVVTGHIFPALTDEQVEILGTVDILAVPVGGNGYTVDGEGASQLIRKLEPKVVIPTHFADKSVKYEVPQADLKIFLDEMGIQNPEELESFKIGSSTILPEQLQVTVLKRAD